VISWRGVLKHTEILAEESNFEQLELHIKF